MHLTHDTIKDIVSTTTPLHIVTNSENKKVATNKNIIKNINNVEDTEVINKKLVLNEDMVGVKSQIAGLLFLEQILKRQEIFKKRQQKINKRLEKILAIQSYTEPINSLANDPILEKLPKT